MSMRHIMNIHTKAIGHRLLTALTAASLALVLGACAAVPHGDDHDSKADASQTPDLDNAVTHTALVRQMQDKGMWYASLAHIDALEQRWGISDESRLLRAEALRQTSQIEASARLYEQLTHTPLRAAAWRGLGLIAGAQGEHALAAKHFEQARQASPTNGLVLSDLGFALILDGRHAEARLPIMQAAQLLPGHPKVRSNLALYLLLDGKPAEARQLMADAGMSAATRQAIERLASELGQGTPVALTAPPGLAPTTRSRQPITAAQEALVLRSSLQLSRTLALETDTAEATWKNQP